MLILFLVDTKPWEKSEQIYFSQVLANPIFDSGFDTHTPWQVHDIDPWVRFLILILHLDRRNQRWKYG